jgi:hypothetical protein
VKIGDAVLVLDDHLAIDQGRFAGQLAASIDHPPIGPRPVITVAGEGPDLTAIDNDQGAVAVMLDLVNPTVSGGCSGTSVGISGLMKPRGAGADRGICRRCTVW